MVDTGKAKEEDLKRADEDAQKVEDDAAPVAVEAVEAVEQTVAQPEAEVHTEPATEATLLEAPAQEQPLQEEEKLEAQPQAEVEPHVEVEAQEPTVEEQVQPPEQELMEATLPPPPAEVHHHEPVVDVGAQEMHDQVAAAQDAVQPAVQTLPQPTAEVVDAVAAAAAAAIVSPEAQSNEMAQAAAAVAEAVAEEVKNDTKTDVIEAIADMKKEEQQPMMLMTGAAIGGIPGQVIPAEVPMEDVNAIWEPAEPDVLSGRGASVNAHNGNKKFRALCFSRKPEFEAGNHAAKRRIATEIVAFTVNTYGSRFLRRKNDKGPWYEMTNDQAILKACQVMRDYKRPDRVALREMMAQNGNARKRQRSQESTPMDDVPLPASAPLDPIIENPYGVHDHDILSGRGAFVNGHIGNQRLRTLALERKIQFDTGNYTEKRALATEIVQQIRALNPPGRFLKRVKENKSEDGSNERKDGLEGWEELSDEKAIHKACQVMRDIDRPDRKDREQRRRMKKHKGDDEAPLTLNANIGFAGIPGHEAAIKESEEKKDTAASLAVLAESSTTAEKAAVEEAVAAAEEALDKALDHGSEKKPEEKPMEVAETAMV